MRALYRIGDALRLRERGTEIGNGLGKRQTLTGTICGKQPEIKRLLPISGAAIMMRDQRRFVFARSRGSGFKMARNFIVQQLPPAA